MTGSRVQASRAVWTPPPHTLNSTVRKQTQMSGSLVIVSQVPEYFLLELDGCCSYGVILLTTESVRCHG